MSSSRVMVKLGTAVIVRGQELGISLKRMAAVVEQVAELHQQGKQMMIVTSGAVAIGKFRMMNKGANVKNIDPRAAAAVGQSALMALYESMFREFDINTAQILIERSDIENPSTRNALCSTMDELLRSRLVPVINENDCVADTPAIDSDLKGVISVADNDSIAALLATKTQTDRLLLLSDVPGVYTSDPSKPDSELVPYFTPEVASSISFGSKSSVGRGGMESKINAARYAMDNGVHVTIANGDMENVIVRSVAGEPVGTQFSMARWMMQKTPGPLPMTGTPPEALRERLRFPSAE